MEGRSRRGVYYDLSLSPYEYKTPYGERLKFSSQKKLEIYRRDVEKELERMTKLLERHSLVDFLPDEIVHLLYRKVYMAFYRKIEG